MTSRIRHIAVRLVVLASILLDAQFCLAQSAGSPAIEVSIDREEIGLNEQAALSISVSGSEQNLPAPVVPAIDGIEFYSQGRSSTVSIVNGQVSAQVTYRYLIIPAREGTYTINSIHLTYNGQAYTAAPVSVKVVATPTASNRPQQGKPGKIVPESGSGLPAQNRDIFIEAVVDKKNPYVSEQVTLLLRFYSSVQTFGSPDLTEPATTGFWTEVLGNSAPYHRKIDGRTYRVLERKYALFPSQTGDLTIGRAVLKTTVAARGRQQDPFDMFGGLFGRGQEVTLSSQPIRINVKPLPKENQPGDFSGTVGKFTLNARLDKSEVEVNEPVTVTFQITGTGNIKSIPEPSIPDLADFRVYGSSSTESLSNQDDKIGGVRSFEKVFLPRKPGQLTIPEVSFVYFDPGLETYKRVSTKPMTVQVRKPEGYVAGSSGYAVAPVTIGRGEGDIRYIMPEIGDLSRQGTLTLFSPIYLAANALPVLLLAGTVIMRRRREQLAADAGSVRSRAAGKEARKRLARARSLARLDSSTEFHAEVYRAVTSYIADKANVSPHGLTTDGVAALLSERRIEPGLIDDVAAIMRQCDFARFAPGSVSAESIEKLMRASEAAMNRIERMHRA